MSDEHVAYMGWGISAQEQIDGFRNEVKELKVENRRLKELIRDLAICACGKYCYGCPHQYDGCDRDQRIREMGVDL